MAVKTGTDEGAPRGIGAGVQPALDIGCDRPVVTGGPLSAVVGTVQLARGGSGALAM